ncbi:ERF family protein, partial [Borreliella afzelii]
MNNVSEKNQDIQNKIQAEIGFLNDMDTLRMNLPRIDKSLNGFNNYYKYQDFNEILEEIENVIKKHNLKLGFYQQPTWSVVEGQVIDYIRTTFYSKSTGYRESFDTRIHTDKLQCNSVNTFPQQVGSAITYFKRYALVGYLNIKSEVDNDAALNYNDYEN